MNIKPWFVENALNTNSILFWRNIEREELIYAVNYFEFNVQFPFVTRRLIIKFTPKNYVSAKKNLSYFFEKGF